MVRILQPTSKAIDEAAAALRHGRLVAFPTETVYGLGGVATNDAAVAAMLRSTLRRLPSADVDVARVVDAFPAERTGADVSEAIRRAVLVDGEAVTTATLLSVIGERGYAATVPIGTYL